MSEIDEVTKLLNKSRPGYIGWLVFGTGFLFSLPSFFVGSTFKLEQGLLQYLFIILCLSFPLILLCVAHRIEIYSDRIVCSYFSIFFVREVYFRDIDRIDLLAFYGDPIVLDLNLQIFSHTSPSYFVTGGFSVTRNGPELIRLLIQEARKVNADVPIHPLILSRYKL
jgi:hypothetical protein